jgi:O-antigen/teichoic acid export membrane protein
VTEPVALSTPGVLSRRFVVRFFLWTLSGDAVSKGAVLVTNLIAVRALEPLEFGLYIGFSATAILAASLWDAGVAGLLTREFAAGRVSPREAAVQTARLRARTAAIGLLAFAVGSAVLVRSGGVSAAAVFAFGAASVVFATHVIPRAMLHARLRFRAAAIALASGRWCTALLSLLALPTVGFGRPLEVLAVAFVAGEALTLAVALASVLREATRVSPTSLQNPPSRTLTLRAALPFAANGILVQAYNRFDIVLLGALASVDQLGLYAPASRMQDALLLISAAIGTVAFPVISTAAGTLHGVKHVQELVNRFIFIALALSLPLTVIFFIYSQPVIYFIMGSEYEGAVSPTRILLWSLPFSAATSALLAGLAGTGHALDTTRVFMVAFAVAAVFHLSLDWWWGAMGAATASLLREPAALLASIIYARRAGILR